MPRPLTIAIDGPVAAGKTVVGRLLAQHLGYSFLDTGLLYRAVTWVVLQKRISLEDAGALGWLAASANIQVAGLASHEHRVLVDGQDVTPYLRRPEVEAAVSQVSAVPAVRRALLPQQRAIAQLGGVVLAGRDIGTVVLPDADLKVFLEASPAERARRRLQELEAKGQGGSVTAVQKEVERRDRLDAERATSPLVPAPDAHRINTDGLNVEQVVERILALVDC
ncbi:MAG: (d)CMP kinase [Chloroflexi bacterium]|nr:(d)CMP kinase [Chloroflexota bacterium]